MAGGRNWEPITASRMSLYDQMANRWVIMDVAFTDPGGPITSVSLYPTLLVGKPR
jgi:hypothetical protein